MSNLLGRILSHDVDSGELFFQSQRRESWSLEEGIVKNAAYGVDRGMGVRAISGEKTGFAYVDDIDLPAIATAADAARSIAKSGWRQVCGRSRCDYGRHRCTRALIR